MSPEGETAESGAAAGFFRRVQVQPEPAAGEMIQREIEINAGKDGIKSTNKEKSSLGYVEIIGGRITIRSGDEPIQAETYYTVEDAKIRIIVNE